MNPYRFLLYPPASWVMAWSINGPGADEVQPHPTGEPMRLFNRPTPDAIAAAKYWNDITSSYEAEAVGNRVVPRLSVQRARHYVDVIAAAMAATDEPPAA